MALRPPPGDLFLMRHGQTEWNAQGRLQGLQDSPLTPLGITQAHRQAWLMRDLLHLPRYASSAGRAQQTARIVFGGRTFVTDARLQEIDIGRCTGMSLQQMRDRHHGPASDGWIEWYDRAPGGEGMAGLEARLRAFLADLPGPALIVTHGITLRMLRLLAMGWPMARFAEMTVWQGAVHLVRDGQQRVFF
ncbi:histidine phosphatase family protein [Paracoccus sp. (in: a-proteobacteria)]|uniref:histidine phosphatase family protein n=1 Tax=Paracoccus sp. TaxID=267 RepID=UPI0032203465